jgi:hypothetical protein
MLAKPLLMPAALRPAVPAAEMAVDAPTTPTTAPAVAARRPLLRDERSVSS